MITPIRYENGELLLLDQRLLPEEESWVVCRTAADVARAIAEMVVRGAPAIGVSAAYGIVLAAEEARQEPVEAFRARLDEAGGLLEAARPTAVNLSWAVRRMLEVAQDELEQGARPADVSERLREEALSVADQDVEINKQIGGHGAMLVPNGARVLTHCNTGSLATAGFGTALGVVRAAVEEGKAVTVVADETRPFLQGSRLTAWECVKDGIPVELITDSMAGALMSRGEIDVVIVGADRIAHNGDVANKIGTYTLAVLARRHGVPFYVAAPTSTIDLTTPDGGSIPIEERDPRDVLEIRGTRLAPEGATARHIAFDVTPASLVTAIITEQGVARAPYAEPLARMLGIEPEAAESETDAGGDRWDDDGTEEPDEQADAEATPEDSIDEWSAGRTDTDSSEDRDEGESGAGGDDRSREALAAASPEPDDDAEGSR